MIKQVAIQLQLLACNTQARAGILFGKDVFNQLVSYHDYIKRIEYKTQPMIPLVLEKAIQIQPDKTMSVKLLPGFTATSHQTQIFKTKI